MKSFPKILIAFFLTVFILQIICVFFLLAAPVASQAAVAPGKFTPQVSIPGFNFDSTKTDTSNIANLVRAIYNYAIGIVGILAAVVLMVGGVLWIVAGGNTTQIGEAKAWIGAALTGLILALTSYLILSTINPALVNLQTTDITAVGKLIEGSSCTTTVDGVKTCVNGNTSSEACVEKGGSFSPKSCPSTCCAYDESSLPSNDGSLLYVTCVHNNSVKDAPSCYQRTTDPNSHTVSFEPDGECKPYSLAGMLTRYKCKAK